LKSSRHELEALDKAGALRPIAFHLEPYFDPDLYMCLPRMAFTEDGYLLAVGRVRLGAPRRAHITPLYLPWQLLCRRS
jgi:hypothetical protein